MSSEFHPPCMVSAGANIMQEREALRMSRSKLASVLGISGVDLRGYEAGTKIIPASALIALAVYIHIRPSTILGEYNCTDCKMCGAPGCFKKGEDL